MIRQAVHMEVKETCSKMIKMAIKSKAWEKVVPS
jgi:hypothetical protein